MNLVSDLWIPVIHQDGKKDVIAPWQLVETDNPTLEINAPRADFQGALYQFLIGLLQTCFAPEDEDEWLKYWEITPDPLELKGQFDKVAFAFELDNEEGAAFLQDYDLPDGKTKAISALLIEAPGGKTLKDNLDHFIKRDRVSRLCPGCTATALFTLQTNAPAGGVGHRVGLRGGGPLTTLIVPKNESAPLWQKLWLNVLDQEKIMPAQRIDARVFPWLDKTRVSDKESAITTPDDAHPFQMYWGMPRRIRLSSKVDGGVCDLCGNNSDLLYREYRTKNHGVNYDGSWEHPLTPYRLDPKRKNLPLPLKGQHGGLGYRHWLGLALQDSENGDVAAMIVRHYNEERGKVLDSRSASLWCFGYDMDNMKARCWYDSRLPIFYLDENQKNNLTEWAAELINPAREVVRLLRSQIKLAWFRRPEDAKGDMSQIDAQFWQATESDFYQRLEQLALLPGETQMAPPGVYQAWFETLQKQMRQVFETATLESIPEDLDLKRIVVAQKALQRKFYGNKTIKHLRAKAMQEETA